MEIKAERGGFWGIITGSATRRAFYNGERRQREDVIPIGK